SFGHSELGGVAKTITEEVKKHIECKIRAVEFSVLQRCAAHCLSTRDINESFMIGEKAVELACDGKTGVMVTTVRGEGEIYSLKLCSTPVELIANKEKKVPEDFVNEAKNQISQKGLDYLEPLIQGEISIPMEGGLPKHLTLRTLL
ncbi:MAG: 6-phosphofructokinase, partial [Anaerotignaceae bacterium]